MLILLIAPGAASAAGWRTVPTTGFFPGVSEPLVLAKSHILEVVASEPGLYRISQTLALNEGEVIDAVATCFNTPTAAFITQTFLFENLGPTSIRVARAEDADLFSRTDTCHVWQFPDYAPVGVVVTLQYTMDFSQATQFIMIGAVAVHLK